MSKVVKVMGESHLATTVCKAASGCTITGWFLAMLGKYESQILSICVIISTIVAVAAFIRDTMRKRKK